MRELRRREGTQLVIIKRARARGLSSSRFPAQNSAHSTSNRGPETGLDLLQLGGGLVTIKEKKGEITTR